MIGTRKIAYTQKHPLTPTHRYMRMHACVRTYTCSIPYVYLYRTRTVYTIHVYTYGIAIRIWY